MGIFDGTALEDMIPEDARDQSGTLRELQPIRVLRVKVHGKWHTRAEGFAEDATDTDTNALCKQARKKFSCAGKAYPTHFEIHGDHAQLMTDWLKDEGYKLCKRAGG